MKSIDYSKQTEKWGIFELTLKGGQKGESCMEPVRNELLFFAGLLRQVRPGAIPPYIMAGMWNTAGNRVSTICTTSVPVSPPYPGRIHSTSSRQLISASSK